MNAFLNHHNGTSLTGVINVTAHSVSLFEENEEPKNIKNIFIPSSNISISEPYEVQIDELGNNFITMYQFLGDINDEKVAGLESLLNYIHENYYSKDEPAINEHHYHITRKLYNQDFSVNNVYNVDKSRNYKTTNHNFIDNNLYNKKQIINNDITNYITKNIIHNIDNIVNIKKDFSTKNYTTNIYRTNNDYIDNNLYKNMITEYSTTQIL